MPETSTVFIQPTLRGERFEAHSIPVDVLVELANYRELVVGVARLLYFQENPKKSRIPKNWANGFQLYLSDIEEGSARPILKRMMAPLAAMTLFFQEPSLDYFEKARGLINEVVASAQAGKPPPATFPQEGFGYFSNFGKSLHEGESIELVIPHLSSTGPIYNRSVRKKILHQTGQPYADPIDILAKVVSVNTEQNTVTLKPENNASHITIDLAEHAKFRKLITQSHIDALKEERGARYLRFSGIGEYDKNDKIQKIISLDDVDEDTDRQDEADGRLAVTASDVYMRLRGFVQFDENWNGPESATFDNEGIKWTGEVLYSLLQEPLLAQPYLYPTPDGEVRAEWQLSESRELCLTFDLSARKVGIVIVDSSNDTALEDEVIQTERQAEILHETLKKLLSGGDVQ